MNTTLIYNCKIINEGQIFKGAVLIRGQFIDKVISDSEDLPKASESINADGMYLVPGVIDDQVHFREPGLSYKGDIASESKAAVAGGLTSYMEMPNTKPQTVTISHLEEKYKRASEVSLANYSFYMGATNNNLKEILKIDPKKVCGVKIFMGSSTGNMLVDDPDALNNLVREIPTLIATHCEDESIIKNNLEIFKQKYGCDIPVRYHSDIRSREACYKSSSKAVELANKYNSRLHLLHISTKDELKLLNKHETLQEKRITAEVCLHHLWFEQNDYDLLGNRIKWNPAVKSREDKEALRDALKNNLLDIVATDHAPHSLEEKQQDYCNSPSGGPLVQHSLPAMLELAEKGVFTKTMVIQKMCHAPAIVFKIKKRGFIREGYYADIVLINPKANWKVTDESVYYKCKWTPLVNTRLKHAIWRTWVNGTLVYDDGSFNEEYKGLALEFDV